MPVWHYRIAQNIFLILVLYLVHFKKYGACCPQYVLECTTGLKGLRLQD